MEMEKVVIVDDEESIRLALKGLLEERGYEVVAEGSDGTQALEICLEHRPHVVIMDISMPNMDGLEAAEEIRESCPTPIILLTGLDKEHGERAVKAGVLAYLTKPVRDKELFTAIELAISRHEEFEALKDENKALKATLESRKVVEKAKGLLMEREGLNEQEAYTRIQKTSMDKRTSMKQVAEIIISTFQKEVLER